MAKRKHTTASERGADITRWEFASKRPIEQYKTDSQALFAVYAHNRKAITEAYRANDQRKAEEAKAKGTTFDKGTLSYYDRFREEVRRKSDKYFADTGEVLDIRQAALQVKANNIFMSPGDRKRLLDEEHFVQMPEAQKQRFLETLGIKKSGGMYRDEKGRFVKTPNAQWFSGKFQEENVTGEMEIKYDPSQYSRDKKTGTNTWGYTYRGKDGIIYSIKHKYVKGKGIQTVIEAI